MSKNLVLSSRVCEMNKSRIIPPLNYNYNISCHLSVKFEDCVCVSNNLYF